MSPFFSRVYVLCHLLYFGDLPFFQPGSAPDNRLREVHVEATYAIENNASINKSSKSHTTNKLFPIDEWLQIHMKNDTHIFITYLMQYSLVGALRWLLVIVLGSCYICCMLRGMVHNQLVNNNYPRKVVTSKSPIISSLMQGKLIDVATVEIITKYQSMFQKGKSTTEHLVKLEVYIC